MKDKQIEALKNCLCDVLDFDYNDERGVTKVDAKTTAEGLYNAGYRKASEVAREIFEEIEEMLNLQAKIVCETRNKYSETDEPLLSFIAMLDGRIYSLRVIEEHIAELKKKYTEDGK